MGTIVTKDEFKKKIRPVLKQDDKTIVLCHGVFDLVHPGHMTHLEQAASMGDILVVSITASKYVRKGPGRPYFSDEQRLHFLSGIGCVDYVLLSEGYTVDDIIENVEPDYYVKGSEYADENADITGKIREERLLVEQHGGQIRYTNGEVFSSTNLINRGLAGLGEELKEYMAGFVKRFSVNDLLQYAETIKGMHILVIGDVIIDRYTYCTVNGLMSKDIGYAARLQSSEEYLGGSLAVAKHLASFCDNVSLRSVIGAEPGIQETIQREMGDHIELKLTMSSADSTIVKHRYLMRNEKREEYKKIFAINNIPEHPRLDPDAMKSFRDGVADSIETFDAVFVCDFGHGLLDKDTISMIQNRAKCVILNCQTNSSNYGMNLITKYQRADYFSLNQKELVLALPEYRDEERESLRNLMRHLRAKTAFLTKGSKGALYATDGEIGMCPAFSLTVKDTVGAGDAFFAVAGAYAAAGASPELSMFAGNIAGALEADIIGNKEHIEKVNVLKYATTLMNV